jgi:hypothetical protein
MQVRKLMLSACLLAGLTAVNLSASPIFGVFSIGGNITVTADTIDWSNTNLPFTPEQANIGSNATDSFAGLAGTTVTIEDFNSATEPVGMTYGPDFFISFNAEPVTFPMLESNFIYPGIFPSAGCTATPAAVGQVCTPGPPITPPSGSPFSFINLPGDAADPIQSTATFQIAGITTDGGTFIANFSASFNAPFQTVLAELGPGGPGSVTDQYDGVVTVTPGTTTPEPDSGYLLASGLALVLLSVGSRRLLRRNQH